MKFRLFLIALFYLVLVGGFAWGVMSERAGIFPHRYIDKLAQYKAGGEGDAAVALTEKIINDLELAPHRFVIRYKPKPGMEYRKLDLPQASGRRGPLLMYQNEGRASGSRLVFATMDLSDALHGAVLIDANGTIAHRWPFHMADQEITVFPHGLIPFADGSLIASFDYGSLEKVDACGKTLWSRPGLYNHMLSYDGEGLWAINGDDKIERIDLRDGQTSKTITVHDIMVANPDTDILSLRQRDIAHPDESNQPAGWQHDPWHLNDVEPLPQDKGAAFPMFAAGDLLISARSLNLVFVMDPQTLRIKWWMVGMARRQHDPDWEKNGTISLYDNNMDRGASRIIAIDPKDNKVQVLFDGKKHDFTSRIRGNHEVLDNGNILITSSQQGRVLEVTQEGEKVFELLNAYDRGKGKYLTVSNTLQIPDGFFDEGALSCE